MGLCWVAWLGASCGGDCRIAPPPLEGDDCTARTELNYVYTVTLSSHLFQDELARLDPRKFSSPSDLLAGMIAPVERDRFSFIASAAGEARFFREGRSLGYGFSLSLEPGALRVLDVFGDLESDAPSSAAKAGIQRGDRVVSVGGEPVERLVTEERLNEAFGPNEPGIRRSFGLAPAEGPLQPTRTATLAVDFYSIVAVPIVQVFDEPGGPVGYFVLRNFTQPAEPILRDAFTRFESEGVTRLIVDLRYNGGGLVTLAQQLGDWMLGNLRAGEVFSRNRFNGQHQACSNSRRFESTSEGLSRLEEVVFLALGGTASASELLINALAPHVPVRIIGERTFGKPVGQFGYPFCGKILRPVTFQTVNASGFGDYFSGLEPTCHRPDDVLHPFGSSREGMLQDALHYLRSGSCPAGTEPGQKNMSFKSTRPWGRSELAVERRWLR